MKKTIPLPPRVNNTPMTQNNLLSEQLHYTGASKTPTHWHLYRYNATEISSLAGESADELEHQLQSNATNWVQVHGFQNTETIQQICTLFNVDFLLIQDILNSDHLTKVEVHDAYNIVILKLLAPDGNSYQTNHLAIVQGDNFLLTFVEHESGCFNDITTALEQNVLNVRHRQSDFLLSVILNSVIANYISILSDIEDELEDLEEALLNLDEKETPGIDRIQQPRRNLRLIRKCILPFKETVRELLRPDNKLIHKSSRPFFSDVNDHLLFVVQTLDNCREMISALSDLYVSNNDQKMNTIMKQLTVVSTIFIPLTFLVGIWGMNFQDMPELSWRHGYLFAWLLMLLIGLAVYLYLRRKKWY